MSEPISPSPAHSPSVHGSLLSGWRQPLAATALIALLLGIGLRTLDAGLPLWLDEVWTGVFAAQPGFTVLIEQIRLDANAPLYYVVMWAWTQIFGLSEIALRFPAFLFGALTPAIALLPTKAIRRDVRLLWAIAMALWVPGIWYSQEARCYSMVLFCSAAATLAYARLLAAPSLRRAALWVGLGSLAILTHYYAAILVACQGLGYLAMHRQRALRTWPAALLFAPTAAWLAWHLPSALRLGGDNAWQSKLTFGDLPMLFDFLLGDVARAAVVTLLILGLLLFYRWLRRDASTATTPDIAVDPSSATPALVAFATALVAAGIVFAIGMAMPSFVDRYLMAFAPGIQLGAALGIAWIARRQPPAAYGIVAVLALLSLNWAAGPRASGFKAYNFDGASQYLMRANIKHLVFLLDGRQAMASDQKQVAAVGSFFFARAQYPVTAETVVLNLDEDPHPRLQAAGKPGTGVIWIYDVTIRGTAAAKFPPRLTEAGSGWQCQPFGDRRFNVLACIWTKD